MLNVEPARSEDRDHDKDGSIRAISRGLRVLQAINRGGSITMMQICRQADIPYPTACRVIETLIKEGMVEREPARKRYRATALVRTLSVGFQDEDALVAVSRPHIVALCHKHGWPVSIATRVGHSMMVRDSTHKLTSLTLHHYAPGYTLPIIECSSGKAYLAFCEAEERAAILSGLRQLDGPAERLAAGYVFLRQVEHRIQFLDDQQTHLLPTADEDLLWIASSLGLACQPQACELLQRLGEVRELVAAEFDALLRQQLRGFNDLGQNRARTHQCDFLKRFWPLALIRLVQVAIEFIAPANDVGLGAGLQIGLGVILVHQCDVIKNVLLLHHHLANAAAQNHRQFAGEGWVIRLAVGYGRCHQVAGAVLVLQAFAAQRGAP